MMLKDEFLKDYARKTYNSLKDNINKVKRNIKKRYYNNSRGLKRIAKTARNAVTAMLMTYVLSASIPTGKDIDRAISFISRQSMSSESVLLTNNVVKNITSLSDRYNAYVQKINTNSYRGESLTELVKNHEKENKRQHKIDTPKKVMTAGFNYTTPKRDNLLNSLENRINMQNYTISKGGIPITMWHGIKTHGRDTRYSLNIQTYRAELEWFYEQGFFPITFKEYANKDLSKVPPGKKPIVFTFDDSTKGHMFYEKGPNGELKISPNSAAGAIIEMARKHPDWRAAGTFFINTAGPVFGEKKYEARKIKDLIEAGFEIGGHTNSHINCGKSSLERIMKDNKRFKQRMNKLLKEAGHPNYRIESFAYPFGSIPRDPEKLAYIRSQYPNTAHAWGGKAYSPASRRFSKHKIHRIETNNSTFPGYFKRGSLAVLNNPFYHGPEMRILLAKRYSQPLKEIKAEQHKQAYNSQPVKEIKAEQHKQAYNSQPVKEIKEEKHKQAYASANINTTNKMPLHTTNMYELKKKIKNQFPEYFQIPRIPL